MAESENGSEAPPPEVQDQEILARVEDPERARRALENQLEIHARRGDVEGLALGFVEGMLSGVSVDQKRFFDLTSEAYHTRATACRREADDLGGPEFKGNSLAKYLANKARTSADRDLANVRSYQAKKEATHSLKSGSQ